jgi:hypothetical protein
MMRVAPDSYHPIMRARRVAMQFMKWGGPILAVVISFGWWRSGSTSIEYLGPDDWMAIVSNGQVSVSYEAYFIAEIERIVGVPQDRGLRIEPVHPSIQKMRWWFGGAWEEPENKFVSVPLWFPLAIVVGLSVMGWRMEIAARRRARIGNCSKCNYNRAGLAPEASCPECGAKVITPKTP